MSEIFLDISLPNSGKEEARLKAQGFTEKKYTRTTAKEIEGAFKRYLLKQLIPQRGLTTPAQINALQKEIDPMVQETMYAIGKNGGKVFKFKMFVPSAKLIAERESAIMAINNENTFFEGESFAPESYGENLESVRKAEKLALNVQNTLTKLRTKRTKNNVQKALNKTRKAQNKLEELAANVKNTPEFVAKVRKAQNNAAKTRRNLESLYAAEVKPINDISAMLRNTHINTYKVSPIKPSGHLAVNNAFVESLIEIKNTRTNNNNRNTNKISSKALVSGLLSTEIRFIRDVVNALIANGMPKQMAIRAGVILANLPQGELKGIQAEAEKAGQARNMRPDFLLQLAQYLSTK